MSTPNLTKHDHVLAGLIFSLQAASMHQLGKIQDPATGEMTRDLAQARSTIDVLEMLKAKCREGTPDELLKLLDGAVMELQMNYMDEMKKSETTNEASISKEGAAGAGTPQDDQAQVDD